MVVQIVGSIEVELVAGSTVAEPVADSTEVEFVVDSIVVVVAVDGSMAAVVALELELGHQELECLKLMQQLGFHNLGS